MGKMESCKLYVPKFAEVHFFRIAFSFLIDYFTKNALLEND